MADEIRGTELTRMTYAIKLDLDELDFLRQDYATVEKVIWREVDDEGNVKEAIVKISKAMK